MKKYRVLCKMFSTVTEKLVIAEDIIVADYFEIGHDGSLVFSTYGTGEEFTLIPVRAFPPTFWFLVELVKDDPTLVL